MALCSIGPRHTMGASSSVRKPIETTCRPCACAGMIILPSVSSRAPLSPSIIGTFGP
jgi:hypothetical protein